MKKPKKLSGLSVTKKTLVLLFVIVIIPLLAVGFAILNTMYHQAKKIEHAAVEQRMVRISENIADQLDKIEQAAEMISTDFYVNELAKRGDTPQRYIQSKKKVEEVLSFNDLIIKAQILSEGEIVWQYGKRSGYAFSEEGNAEYLKTMENRGNLFYWSPLHTLYRLEKGRFDDAVDVISLYSSIYERTSLKKNGVLALHVEERSVRELYDNYVEGDSAASWIAGPDGSILSATDKQWLKSGIPKELDVDWEGAEAGNTLVHYHDKAMRLYWQKCPDKEYYLVQLNKETVLLNRYVIYAFLVISIFLILCIGYIITYRIFVIRPLEQLTKQMERAGNLDFTKEELKVQGDEIGLLTIAFQNMVGHIDELIDKVYVEKIKTQEAEKEAMLSQINPHFLYNTLDSIRWNALSHGEREVSAQLEALAVMLRNTLNFGQTETTIEQEMKIIESYCFLLQARFRNEIDVEIQAEPKLLGQRIPKLLIQPLAENAYKHGLENQLGEKKIRIRIKECRGKIHILVADNGKGFDCEAILAKMEDENSRECFALKNIRDRLRLTYGGEGFFRIYSKPGRGTIAGIVLPYEKI